MLRKFVTTLGRNIITVRLIGRGLIQVADGNVEGRTMSQSFSGREISKIKHNLLLMTGSVPKKCVSILLGNGTIKYICTEFFPIFVTDKNVIILWD